MYPESHWNYRVLASEYDGEVYLAIYEVHYKNDVPVSHTVDPVTVGCETIKGLNWTLNRMKEALKKPILWGGDKFPNEYKPETK